MVFSSLIFLFMYLPVTLLIYYIVPRKARNLFLFFINLVFYGWGEPTLVLLMLASIVINYAGGYFVEKCKPDKKKAIADLRVKHQQQQQQQQVATQPVEAKPGTRKGTAATIDFGGD